MISKSDIISHHLRLFLLLSISVLTIACGDGSNRPVRGFVLPEGDIATGEQVFATTGCRYCHTVTNLDLPASEVTPVLSIELGGKFHRVRDYGELLTSVVNPDHTVLAKHRELLPDEAQELEDSAMPDFNDGLTVAELIDLVAFLHSRYEELSPQYRGVYYGP